MSRLSPHPTLMNRGQTAPRCNRNSHLICFVRLKQCNAQCKHFFLKWFLPSFTCLAKLVLHSIWYLAERHLWKGTLLWKIALIYTVSLVGVENVWNVQSKPLTEVFYWTVKITRQGNFWSLWRNERAHMKDVSTVAYKHFPLWMAALAAVTSTKMTFVLV